MSLLEQAKAAGKVTLTLQGISKSKEFLTDFYNDNNKAIKLMATIINSSITDNKPCFMMSRNTLAQLIQIDANQKKGIVLYPRDYKELLMRMMKSGIFECLNSPSIKKGKGIAGLYRVKSEELRQYYTDIEVQEQRIIEEYCAFQGIPLITL